MKKNTLLFCFLASVLLLNAQNDAVILPPENRNLSDNQEQGTSASSVSNCDDTVFYIVENPPRFNGAEGYAAVSQYVVEHLKYPEEARKKGIQGRIITSFIVEKDGHLSDIKVVKGIEASCDAEAIRVIQSMPNWEAGTQNGKPIRIKFTLPIIFNLRGR